MRFLNWLFALTGFLTVRRRRKSLLHMPERLESRAYLSSFVVTSTEDAPDAHPGDGLAETAAGETSLRAAIEEANAAPGPDAIVLPAGIFDLTARDLEITDPVSISGAGPDETIIDASNIDQAFHVLGGASLELDNLSVAVSTGADPVLIEDGTLDIATASVTVRETDSDSPATDGTELPAIDPAAISVNPRQAEFLTALYQSRPARQDETILFYHEPIIVDQRVRLDAMHDITGPRIKTLPGTTEQPDSVAPTPTPTIEQREILADMNRTSSDPDETPSDKRQKVLNALFENRPDAPPSARNVSNEATEKAEAEQTRESLPMLLPMKKDGELLLVPDDPQQDRPAPPPLPESKYQAEVTRRPAAGAHVAVAGMLMGVVRPTTWKRTLRRISKWSRLVV